MNALISPSAVRLATALVDHARLGPITMEILNVDILLASSRSATWTNTDLHIIMCVLYSITLARKVMRYCSTARLTGGSDWTISRARATFSSSGAAEREREMDTEGREGEREARRDGGGI